MALKPVIAVNHLTNKFGKQVVHNNLDLTVYEGEILGIVGSSGSGKTVLMRTLIGLNRPQQGTVTIRNRPAAEWPPNERAHTFGVLFQQGALFSGLSVVENVLLPLQEFTDLSMAEQRKIALSKLEAVGMPANAVDKKASELSGGMIKRAALARALALEPNILFLDEPTSGLDPIAAAEFDELIQSLHSRSKLTIVMITHDLDTVFGICQRVAVLVHGKIIVAPLPEILKNRDPWVWSYFHGPRARTALLGQGVGHGA